LPGGNNVTDHDLQDDPEYCAERLKALSDPLRLQIIQSLRQGELAVSDIAALLEAEIVNISHHLKILKNAGLVLSRREGRYIYYRLHPGLSRSRKSVQSLDLGCCKLQLPYQSPDESSDS
jgi:DNA-binding transcriptional ArsR family regulator